MNVPTPPPSLCTCFRVRRLARLLTQRYDRELAPSGLTLNQYSILRRAQRSPHTIGELAQELGMDRTTLSRDLRLLATAGRVELVPGPVDARRRWIRVTAAGDAVLATALPMWRKAQDAIDSVLGSTGVDALHDRLDHAMQRLEDMPAA